MPDLSRIDFLKIQIEATRYTIFKVTNRINESFQPLEILFCAHSILSNRVEYCADKKGHYLV